MKIILKRLTLTNFKGIKSRTIEFDDGITEIRGANASGKTTLFDAFLWLLFGKDSQGKKDFGIKTYDANGDEIHRIEHSVTATMTVDGVAKTLSRTLREKWQTERGKAEEIYKGNETVYEIDGVPCKMADYNSRIADWIDEELFKLATNPAAFVSLKTQEQRQILMKMVGIPDDGTLATEYGKEAVIKILNSGKTLADRAKELAKNKTKLKKELDLIPARIDEVNRSIKEHRAVQEIEADIASTRAEFTKANAEIAHLKQGGGASKVRAAEIELEQARAEYNAKTTDAKARNNKLVYDHNSRIQEVGDKIKLTEKAIRELKNDIAYSNQVIEKKRVEYTEIRKEQYPLFDNDVCPCCGRAWETEKLEELKAEYNTKRVKFYEDQKARLTEINATGAKYVQLVKDSEAKITEKQAHIEELKAELNAIESYSPKLEDVGGFDESPYLAKIAEAKAAAESNIVDTTEIDNINARLIVLDNEKIEALAAEKQKQRIAELEADAKTKAQAVADIEKEEDYIEDFSKLKIDLLDKAVNGKFELVKFKLYDHQINGGFTECCTPTINGVPYDDLNGSSKINAGLDIVNTLQKFYDIQAPVFIDNKERITEPLKLCCQTIYLRVFDDKDVSEDKKIIDINKEVA
jgi:DNA repair exonuclease SbcCD ATPase subunit